jgi:hypothetical protein
MWERSQGVGNDGCRDARALRSARTLRSMPRGASATYVLTHAGQPHTRLDRTFSYCGRTSTGSTTRVRMTFTSAGRLSSVT